MANTLQIYPTFCADARIDTSNMPIERTAGRSRGTASWIATSFLWRAKAWTAPAHPHGLFTANCGRSGGRHTESAVR